MIFSGVRPSPSGLHYAWVIVAVTFTVAAMTAGVRATPALLIGAPGRADRLIAIAVRSPHRAARCLGGILGRRAADRVRHLSRSVILSGIGRR